MKSSELAIKNSYSKYSIPRTTSEEARNSELLVKRQETLSGYIEKPLEKTKLCSSVYCMISELGSIEKRMYFCALNFMIIQSY